MIRKTIGIALALAALLAVPAKAVETPIPLMKLTPIATLTEPVNMAVRDGDTALFVVEKVGRVRAIRGGALDPTPVLDITGQVSDGLEQGLLGLAFTPGTGSFLYVNYTDPAGDTHIVEYAMAGGVANVATRRELLFVDQPFANHNGGTLKFGPDGYLYIALGDGGSGGDPMGNGQNRNTLLGKLLRIDPRGAVPYAIPASNPFAGQAGMRGEIWAYGLRNPWQFSFDRDGGDLWIADVGQNLWEEINHEPAGDAGGRNYGWNEMEGTHPYEDGVEPANHTPPVYEYPHGRGCSITGGYVYRGSAIPAMRGFYVFSDFCAGRVWILQELLGMPIAMETGLAVPSITAFGEDAAGELYAMTLTGDLFRIDPLL